jgi:hypothetical protein
MKQEKVKITNFNYLKKNIFYIYLFMMIDTLHEKYLLLLLLGKTIFAKKVKYYCSNSVNY